MSVSAAGTSLLSRKLLSAKQQKSVVLMLGRTEVTAFVKAREAAQGKTVSAASAAKTLDADFESAAEASVDKKNSRRLAGRRFYADSIKENRDHLLCFSDNVSALFLRTMI